MKNIVCLFTCLFVVSVAYAQITLDASTYPASVTGTDSLMATTVSSTFPSFAPTVDGIWDMSTVTDSATILYAYRVPTNTYQFADSNFYNFSTFTYQGNIQSSIVGAGILEYGLNVQSGGSSLFSITFGPTDSIIIPTQDTLYSSPRTKIAFPAMYHSSWSSAYSYDLKYEVSISPIYDHTPGIVRRYVTEKDSVTGWGKMRVKDITGGPSSWFNVLQVQTTITGTDSFFLNGAVAPGTLLSDLGLVQGQTDTTYEQNYYRKEEVTPFANVKFTNGTFTTPVKATTHVQRLDNVGVEDITGNSGLRIYPNPVTGNHITIELPAINGSWTYELTDICGGRITAGPIETNSTPAQISLPSSLSPGVYYMKLYNGGKQACVKPIDVVK